MTRYLPTFADSRLEALNVCAMFHRDEPSWRKLAPICVQSKCKTGQTQGWLQFTLDQGDDVRGHLHIDIGRNGFYQRYDSRELKKLEYVNDVLDKFTSQECDAHLTAHYKVLTDELPKRGMLRTSLRLSTESCGSRLTLSGAKFSIDGDLFSDVEWEISDTDQGVIAVGLHAFSELIVKPNFLIAAEQLLHDGFECFVLESTNSRIHDAVPRGKAEIPKRAEA
jgi:hypothetical protein